jgi:hypothetical protein
MRSLAASELNGMRHGVASESRKHGPEPEARFERPFPNLS